MMQQTKLPGRILEAGKAAMTGALCCVMAGPQAFAAASAPVHNDVTIPAPMQTTALTADQKTLHALNRLTFGPRPGDQQAVTRMGLEDWFQRQLHPETIDDSALQTRLDQFPALKLSPVELEHRYPPPQAIRQIVKQGGGMPSDPVEHAIYADAIAAYEAKAKIAGGGADAQQKVANAGSANAGSANDMANADGDDGSMVGKQDTAGTGQPMAGGDAASQTKGKGKKAGAAVVPMSDEEVDAVLALPADQRMAKILSFSPQQRMSFRRGLRPYQLPELANGLSPEQREVLAALQGTTRMVGAEALESRIERDVYSERQLQAVMDDFWLNHFSVYVKKNQKEPYYLAAYERDTILPHALGHFENLLIATAESPAMLMFLDNWQSVGPDSIAAQRGKRFSELAPNSKIAQVLPKGINENYARELLELHTLGVRCEVSADKPASSLDPSCGKGYTQADVQNVAKVLTGWTIDRAYQGGGRMVFDESRHEGGSKTVLGVTIKENGYKEGLQVLHMLATSPATAHFVCDKLAIRFVSDTPPPALVDRMAATFLKSDGDIKAVLTTMFHSPEFWAPSVYRAKVKTPIEFVASALRASDASVANPIALVQAMNQLGMPIYGMQTPNGYSWQADQWVSSNALVSRMNFALVLSGSRLPGTRTNWPQLLGDSPDPSISTAPSAQTELQLESLILGQPAAPRTRATVLDQFNNPTAQHAAEQNLALKEDAPDDDIADSVKPKNVYGKGRKAQGGGFQADRPETPLDTMAGLLLGSPDFQRR